MIPGASHDHQREPGDAVGSAAATRASLVMGPTNTAGRDSSDPGPDAIPRRRRDLAERCDRPSPQDLRTGPSPGPHHRIRPLAVRAAWTKRLLQAAAISSTSRWWPSR